MERMDTQVGPVCVEVVEPLKILRIVVEDNEHGISADLTFTGRHAPIEEPRTTRRNGPRIVQDITRMTQLGRWSGWVRAGGQMVTLDQATTPGTRDRSWGVRHVGMRDPQVAWSHRNFRSGGCGCPHIWEDRVIHFFINEDGDGKVWNLGFAMVRDGGACRTSARRDHGSGIYAGHTLPGQGGDHGAGCRWGHVPDRSDTSCPLLPVRDRYMNPDWAHGLNKGPLAIGYDEVASSAQALHGSRFEHPQAFATVEMTTPDGILIKGHGCFESIVIGRHVPSGFTTMFDVP